MAALPKDFDQEWQGQLENLSDDLELDQSNPGAFPKNIGHVKREEELENLSDDIKLDPPNPRIKNRIKDRLEILQYYDDVLQLDKSRLKLRKDDWKRYLSIVEAMIEKNDESNLTFSKMEKEFAMKVLIRAKENLESTIFGIEIEISNKTIDIFENALAISDLEKTIESEK